jgi:hypothetical protein
MDNEMKITFDLPGAGAAHNFNEADPWTTITVSRDAITFDMELRNPHHNERHRIDFDGPNEARDFAYFAGLLTTTLRDNRARLEENPHVIRRLITFFAHMSAFLRATNLTDEEWAKQYNSLGYGQSREEVLAILAADLTADEESEAALHAQNKFKPYFQSAAAGAVAGFLTADEIAGEMYSDDRQSAPSSPEGSGPGANVADAGSASAGAAMAEGGQREDGEAK